MATLKMGSTTVLTDTTLANAVQDNVTRLGTVTSANLANTAIVYPAGHVIQTVFHKLSASESGGMPTRNSTAWGGFSTAFAKSITPLKNDSDILINVSLIIGEGTGVAAPFRFYDNTNSAYIGVEGGDGLFGFRMLSYATAMVINYTYIYENPTIASTPNAISIELYSKSDATVYLNRRQADAGASRWTSTMILQEISR